ncbi:MAG: UbiA family prenyltransferase [Methanobrevibacter sp.]|jgi:geranylgeranylglycerol-phosphate geranylgeranyltransferase|nr:UbiA family prenyltransferase [Candidatus Methanovirga aequatorialis]
MNPYLEILRPFNGLMSTIAPILVGIMEKNMGIPILIGILAVFLSTGGGNVINDFYDYRIDSINRPDRPIPSGKISLKNAKNYGLSLFITAIILGIVISIMINSYLPCILVMLNCTIMYYYGRDLKKLPLIGNITVAYLTGSCFIFGGLILGKIYIPLFLSFFAFMMTLSREIIKDIEDVKGDELENANTFPIKYGLKSSSSLASTFILIPTFISPILYFINIFNVYYITILLIAIILFVVSAYRILINQDKYTASKVSKLIKTGMFITFIAFAAGSI